MFDSVVLFFIALTLAIVTCNCSSLVNITKEHDEVFTGDHQSEIRIIGGTTVPLGGAPFMASLRSLTNVHFCGGVIVSNRFILTAASCTTGRAANSINVIVGTITLNAGGATHRSAAIINYPGFNANTLVNE